MDLCFNCGSENDPDSTSCRACGASLGETEFQDPAVGSAPSSESSKVELISRGWEEVVETVEAPADPFEDDDLTAAPLAPGSIEVAVDDITVIESVPEEETQATKPTEPTDPWDHLRPHGEQPPLQRLVTVSGRVGQVAALLAAIGALASAGAHFFLNLRLEGRTSGPSVKDVELVADWSLVAVAGLIAVAMISLFWWMIRVRSKHALRLGKPGLVALLALVAGSAVTGASFAVKQETVNEAIAANSLIVLGLGLLATACVAAVRMVVRVERKGPA